MGSIPPFAFNEEVAKVFDDMAHRSIPFYQEVQRLTVTLAQRYAREATRIYDLGCSTGATTLLMRDALQMQGPRNVTILGLDSSEAMCTEARKKLGIAAPVGDGGAEQGASDATHAKPYGPAVSIVNGVIETETINNASVVIMNYTLQFVPPKERYRLLRSVHDGLIPGGILLISDKMLQSSTDVSRAFVDIYYDLKRAQGYSQLEIAQKREALENVLIPYRLEEEMELLERSGFSSVDIYFSWCNFTSLLCVKDGLS
jgi:tRNA (cmo5U34)-methyltransferase